MAGGGFILGLYHMGARWYDPSLARWVSPDIIVPDPANPQSLNRYSYGYGNPVKFADPTGHSGELPPWLQKAWDWIVDKWSRVTSRAREWWAYHNPCSMSIDPMCRAFSISPPSASDTAAQVFRAQGWAGGIDWQKLDQIAQTTDQAQRLARLSNVFRYTPGELAPGSFEFATSSRQEQLDAFLETYFSDFDVEVIYGGDLGAARYGFFEGGTIVVGEAAFAEGFGQVGRTLFHEWLEQYRGDLTHEQIYQLEQLWLEWYSSQPQP